MKSLLSDERSQAIDAKKRVIDARGLVRQAFARQGRSDISFYGRQGHLVPKRTELVERQNSEPHHQCLHDEWTQEAIKVNGEYVMYIDGGLIAYSEDLLHWKSEENANAMPGGECCFALGEYDPSHPDNMILFTGGAHTGHFYGVGEILLTKADVTRPVHYLPRSPLFAEAKYPYENGFAAEAPHKFISSFADCIFFNGLTRYDGKWWVYYGGSEYYTCLTTAPVNR